MPTDAVITLAAVFTFVALVSGLLASRALTRESVVRKRLREVSRGKGPSLVLADIRVVDAPDPKWQKLSRLVPRSPVEMTKIRRRLANAGYHATGTAVFYAASELVLPIILGVTTLLVFGVHDRRVWFFAVTAAILGYLLPGLVLDYLIRKRRKQIRNGLPDVLDLLVVCLEAGSSLDQAILKASEDLEIAYPALAEELRFVNTETRAGKARLEAFANLAKRTQVDDVRALVAMLTQTDRFGTSVAQALRTLADTMRTKRRQRAEEQAAKVGVKLVFPLVFFLFPALYVVALGPAAIRIVRVLFPLMTGAR